MNGFTPADSSDLLIASLAGSSEAPLLAYDSDFERIAEIAPLRLAA